MSERIEIKAALTVTDEGAIEGIAWDYTTPDSVGDVLTKGAIIAPATLPMLFQHDQSQVVSVWESITESDTGLIVKGRLLVDDLERAREVRAMIRNKAVSGLSIGFVTTKATRNAKGRTITAADLHEKSVVAIPCHPRAQITSLKSDDTKTQKEMTMDPEEIEKMIATAIAAIPANDAPESEIKAFEAVQKRLDDMEAKAARPQGVHIATPALNLERKAFGSFLRRGVERMAPEDQKNMIVANDASAGYLAPTETATELPCTARQRWNCRFAVFPPCRAPVPCAKPGLLRSGPSKVRIIGNVVRRPGANSATAPATVGGERSRKHVTAARAAGRPGQVLTRKSGDLPRCSPCPDAGRVGDNGFFRCGGISPPAEGPRRRSACISKTCIA